MFTAIRNCILQKILIPEADLEKSLEYCYVHQYKKGQFILRAGEYCRFFGFLNSGLIMSTIDNDGKEIAANFIIEQCFFTYTEGLTHNVPSHKNFVALEDSEVIMISKEKLPLIYAINSRFETLFSQLLAEELRNMSLKEQSLRTQSSESRYLKFLDTFPSASNRIPLKHIAGYLGIEPESLSRLRKRLAGK